MLNLRSVVAIAIYLTEMTMFSDCEKDSKNPSKLSSFEEGVYVWTYTTTNKYRGFSWNGTPTIEFKKGKYTYKNLWDSKYYTSGSGNYSINAGKIIFDLKSYPIPMESIGVIEELLLIGEYDYALDGKKLTFSKTVFPITPEVEYCCEFELVKK